MALDFEKTETMVLDGGKIGEIRMDCTPFAISMRDACILRGYHYSHSGTSKKRATLPLVCIPSELGSQREFEHFVPEIMALENGPNSVITFSARGRGQSDRSALENYSPLIAAEDLIAICDVLGLHSVAILANGGGLLTALLAAPKRPSLIVKLIANDGSPERDGVGIARLQTLAKNNPPAKIFNDAVKREKHVLGSMFPAFEEVDWTNRVAGYWNKRQEDGPSYDPQLNGTLDGLDFEERQPTLWNEFQMFHQRPVLLIRGANSPLVTSNIAERMKKIVPQMEDRIVSGQGHFPKLTSENLANDIAVFLKS